MTAPADEPAVSWRSVAKVYPDGHRALDGVTLDVARGEALAILGTSGSGKTTLLKMVNRLIDPTSRRGPGAGASRRPSWDPIALRRSIGYVIQEAGLMPHLDMPGQRRPRPATDGRAPRPRSRGATADGA